VAFTQEQKQMIADAIARKKGAGKPQITCPVCHTSSWSIGDNFVRLVLQTNPSQIILAGPSYPLIPLLCSNCGNTQLLNVFILGIAEAFGVQAGTPAVLEKTGGANG